MKRKFNADIKELDCVNDFLKEIVKEIVNRKTLMNLNLAVEEIFANICFYSKAVLCFVEINVTDKDIIITFIDDGMKFNPLDKNDPDIMKDIQNREVGGLGIYITKKLMDKVEYEYIDNKNVLRLWKGYR